MKLFFFDITKKDLQCFTEVFTMVPFFNDETYKLLQSSAEIWNDGLYSRLRFCNEHTAVKNIEECDYAILPFKFCSDDIRIQQYCSYALERNKKVINFFNDDSSEVYNIPENLFLFRTSLYKSQQQLNERILPVIVPDHFPVYYQLQNIPENQTISFCGYTTPYREEILKQIESVYFNINFIRRIGFYAPEVPTKVEAKKTFYRNLLSCSYALCMRGNGNFSYRFYEALSFGRVPIVIESDDSLPFNNIIDWSKHIIHIKKENISELPNIINEYKISPRANRRLWEKYFSPEGYYTHFLKQI